MFSAAMERARFVAAGVIKRLNCLYVDEKPIKRWKDGKRERWIYWVSKIYMFQIDTDIYTALPMHATLYTRHAMPCHARYEKP